MKKATRRRALSLLMVLAMLLTMAPATPLVRAVETLSTNVTVPFSSTVSFEVPVADGSTQTTSVTSNSFRIPAMVTLQDGTLLAAADIRWDTTYDGGGLDTLVARSTDGGVSWEYTLANYLGDNGNVYNGSSTCFIDPSLTVAADGQTVYMLCDLYPYGVALNGSKETTPSTTVGFTDAGYLKLSADNHSSYGYYLKDGKIYSNAGTQVTGYTVNGYFDLYDTNGNYVSNLFYADSPYKVVRTGFLYLTKSTDGGKTWSEPTLLNLKTASEQVCLVGPGRGITTENGTMVFPVYSYGGSTESQRMGFVYSADGGNTWQRAQSSVSWSSEAAVVEIGAGTLRFFYRNGTGSLYYVDYSLSSNSWGSAVNTGVATNSNTQMSAITYSKTVDGKQVVLVSCPAGPNAAGSGSSDGSCRINGRIFAGLVNANGTMTWSEAMNVTGTTTASALSGSNYTDAQGFFAYSCLTERADGSIAILYENNQFGWGAGSGKYYTITMKAFSASALGLSFDDGSGDETPDPVPDDPEAEYEITLAVGQSKTVTVSDTETIGTAGTFTSDDGNVNYVVRHYANTASYQKVTAGIESGKKYLLVCSNNYAVTTSSSSNNAWYTESLPLAAVNFDGSESAYFWTITETTDGYYIQNPSGQYMTIETGTGTRNYTVTLSSTPFVCDIVSSGTGYMIFANGTNIGLNNAGGNNMTALGWPSDSNTVWSLYEYVQQGGTEVEITGLGVTPGTMIAVGDIVYTVIVEPLEVSENCFVMNGSQKTLDAVSDLGLSGTDYTVTYEETKDDNCVITLDGATITAHESAVGTAIITATVKNANGVLVGTITYTVTVSSVLITDVEDVFVAVGSTAIISSLNGEVITSLLDESIATIDQADGTVLSEGTITITAVDNADNINKNTAIVVGTTQFNIHIVPANSQNTDSNKYLYIEVATIENCTVYYAINASELHQVQGTGALVDETFYDGFNIMFFAVPDEGYVLTEMAATQTSGSTTTTLKDFYSLADGERTDGSDSTAWPLDDPDATAVPGTSSDAAWKTVTLSDGSETLHGFRWALLQGNMTLDAMRQMFTAALALGAEGATTITKNESDGINASFAFRAERLPTLTKTIVKVNGEAYTEGMAIEFGDVITYQFAVTSYSTNVNYTSIRIFDDKIGFDTNASADLQIPDNAIDTAGTYTYTAEYTINEDDVHMYENGRFVNDADLHYFYSSTYSAGEYDRHAQASVSCDISGMVYYVWADTVPQAIVNDPQNYPLPGQTVVTYNAQFQVANYTGAAEYVVTENGVAVGKWEFKHWELNGNRYTGGETETMAASGSLEFVGVWEYTAYPTYTVSYQWSGAPVGVTLPTDPGAYYAGQSYQVDPTYKAGDTYTYDGVTYTFGGWKLDGVVVTGQQTMGQGDVTLVGVWTGQQNYTSLTIEKTGHEAIDENQTFLFKIEGEGLELTVTVHGSGCVTIDGLKVNGQYTVTEITGWSWRYRYISYSTALTNTAVENGAILTLNDQDNTITFTNEREEDQWLDGDSWLDNLFDGEN